MEPRGCNRSQPAANGAAAKTLEQAKAVAVGCDRLPESFHGKGAPKKGRGSPRLLRKKRQILRTRRPTGLDAATLTAEVSGVKPLANSAPQASLVRGGGVRARRQPERIGRR